MIIKNDKLRIAVIFSLVVTMMMSIIAGMHYYEQLSEKEERRVRREAAKVQAEQDREKLRAAFAQERAPIMVDARRALSEQRFAHAVEKLHPYREVLDPEATELYQQAQAGQAKLAAEEKAAQDAVAEAKRRARAQLEARIGKEPVPSNWDGAYYEVERLLKRTAHDPDSIDMEPCTKAVVTETGWRTRCAFRGRNAFGGLILTEGVFEIRHGEAYEIQP